MGQMARNEISLQMLAAWNNIDLADAPPEWTDHLNEWTRDAWVRVAVAAIKAIRKPTPAMLYACDRALKRYIDGLPAKRRTFRVPTHLKATLRFHAMLDEAIEAIETHP